MTGKDHPLPYQVLPEGGLCPTLEDAKQVARNQHGHTGREYTVRNINRGDKVLYRVKANPGFQKPSFQVMPPLSEEEYQSLKADIAENGMRVPIVKDQYGNIIDGHHRERALRELEEEGHDRHDLVGLKNGAYEYVHEETVAEKRESSPGSSTCSVGTSPASRNSS